MDDSEQWHRMAAKILLGDLAEIQVDGLANDHRFRIEAPS